MYKTTGMSSVERLDKLHAELHSYFDSKDEYARLPRTRSMDYKMEFQKIKRKLT